MSTAMLDSMQRPYNRRTPQRKGQPSMSGEGLASRTPLRRRPGLAPHLTNKQRMQAAALRAELFAERQFRRHGRYIARHPIRTLLLACFLITSLFYPAVGIFLWSSKGGPGVSRGDARSVWRSLSTPLLDSFASSGRKHHNSLRDLRMIWDDASDLHAVDVRDVDTYSSSMAAAEWMMGTQSAHTQSSSPRADGAAEHVPCRSLRIEHVFVSTDDVIMGLGPRYGALHGPILRSALDLQRTIEAILQSDDESRPRSLPACIKAPEDGHCLSLSPLAYWSHNLDGLVSDSTPTSTVLASKRNYTEHGVPLRLSTTLAGRNHLFHHLPRADHLALTFFLEDSSGCKETVGSEVRDSTGRDINEESASHRAWLQMLRNVTSNRVNLLSSDYRAPKETILRFTPKHPSSAFPVHRALLIAAYVAMFAWLTRNFTKMRKVHSKYGLAFTACVELVISMTLAVSICALSGVRLTLLPWEILPFVIVVIGSENTFVLTNAIISTPISLTVSSRVATGLGKVGVPIAVTVFSDVLLMSVIAALVDVRAVREFCIFAIFALLVDFVMQMTMYTTVLTIDMQRLELADLLSQDYAPQEQITLEDEDSHSEIGPDFVGELSPVDEKEPQWLGSDETNRSTFIKVSCRAAWRARTARTVSLSLLLALLFGIYIYHGSGYSSQQIYRLGSSDASSATSLLQATAAHPLNASSGESGFDPFAHLASSGTQRPAAPPMPWWYSSPSARFWHALNPEDAPHCRVKIEPWTVVSLSAATSHHVGKQRSFASWAIFRPRVRAFIWFLKLVVLPIAGTTAILWVLLLYLLKDTELLEAQQGKLDAIDQDDKAENSNQIDHAQQISGMPLDAVVHLESSAHASDIVMTASGGQFLVSIARDWTLHVWRPSRRGNKAIRTDLNKLLGSNFSPPSTMDVATSENILIIGHANGGITLFTLSSLRLLRSSLQAKTSDVSPNTRAVCAMLAPRPAQASPTNAVSVLTFHRDGSVWSWSMKDFYCTTLVSATKEYNWNSIAVSAGLDSTDHIRALASGDGRVQIYRTDAKVGIVCIAQSSPCDTQVCSVALKMSTNTGGGGSIILDQEAQQVLMLAIGTTNGQIITLDGTATNEIAARHHAPGNAVMNLRILTHDASDSSASSDDHRKALVAFTAGRVSVLELVCNGVLNDRSRAQDLDCSSEGGVQRLQQSDVKYAANGQALPHRGLHSPQKRSFEMPAALNGIDKGVPQQLAASSDGTSPMNDAETAENRNWSWSIVAEFDCRRGGAAVVIDDDAPVILGIRRRAEEKRTGSYGTGTDSTFGASSRPLQPRWEIFEVCLDDLLDMAAATRVAPSSSVVHAPISSLSLSQLNVLVRRSALPLEEASKTMTLNQTVDPDLASTSASGTWPTNTARVITRTRGPALDKSSSLSFTRLDRISAFYKNLGSFEATSNRRDQRGVHPSWHRTSEDRLRGGISFVFGNALGVVYARSGERTSDTNSRTGSKA